MRFRRKHHAIRFRVAHSYQPHTLYTHERGRRFSPPSDIDLAEYYDDIAARTVLVAQGFDWAL
jgi:hypothetical protein